MTKKRIGPNFVPWGTQAVINNNDNIINSY